MTAGRGVVGTMLATMALTLVVRAQDPAPAFRASAEVVLVPVWVTQGERPVAGLTAADFTLTDNGVPQEISSTAADAQPVDVTLVLDTSGSLQGESLETIKSGVQQIARALNTRDRVRLLAFANVVVDVFGTRPGGTVLPVERIPSGGQSAVYDALAAALISTPRNERPQLIFGVSDGLDNASFLDARQVVGLAGSSSAAMYIALMRHLRTQAVRSVWAQPADDPNTGRLRDAAERTGGLLLANPSGTALPQLFASVLADFRMSYLLGYTPTGVAANGWHRIQVRTKDRRYNVRAREGYQR